MRMARTCYDHFAGRLGVAIADALTDNGYLLLTEDGGTLTSSGEKFFGRIGLDLEGERSQRPFCRPCLDWSERRYHLAGTLGARITGACFDAGWVKRKPQSRVEEITTLGRRKFREVYGLRLEDDT
jgi:hypothetical protein